MNLVARQVTRQRIDVLFQQALNISKYNPELAQHYVVTARKIAMAARIRLPTNYKRRICKNCHLVLLYGRNCRVRIKSRREKHVVVTCLGCGAKTRYIVKTKRRKQIE
ncbi:MAG: ribonuclease P [Candidatus Bathyarchaeota archaeon]|nr:ribonuclease P [Candidatus Bathyarchaeota archaeon]